MAHGVDVSVLLATRDRAGELAQTLHGFTQLRTAGLRHEIIVADNADDPAVAALVQSFADRMPVRRVAEPAAGKNRALNAGLASVQGELLAFTDDDVTVDPDWLRALCDGAARHPEAALFGGRIVPHFPPGTEDWVAQLDFCHWFIRSAYVLADWGSADAAVDAERIWGPNMMVRRSVLDAGVRFNPELGPRGADYVMGGETEFLRRAEAAGFGGIYLPDALVHHRIRPEQCSSAWLRGRAFRMGRGHAAAQRQTGAPRIAGVPRYLYRELLRRALDAGLASLRGSGALAAWLEFEELRGQIRQFRIMRAS